MDLTALVRRLGMRRSMFKGTYRLDLEEGITLRADPTGFHRQLGTTSVEAKLASLSSHTSSGRQSLLEITFGLVYNFYTCQRAPNFKTYNFYPSIYRTSPLLNVYFTNLNF